MTMNRKRFMLLAVALVAVNSFFWLAQGGFALPRAFIDQYFGSRMIRAEVVVQTPTGADDYLIDRGVIKAVTPGAIMLKEKDGRMVTIDIGTSASVPAPAAARAARAAAHRRARAGHPPGERAGRDHPGRGHRP